MSKGAQELLKLVQEIYPNQKIELEHNVADRGSLFVDIFLPRMNIGFEFDGEQHFQYIEHFHGDRRGFLRAQRRDAEKDEACREKGIILIRVAYNEPMTRDHVMAKIEEALSV